MDAAAIGRMRATVAMGATQRARGGSMTAEDREDYPHLYQMMCEPSLDRERMLFMLDLIEKVRDGRVSQHDASVEAGENLVNAFCRPRVQKTVSKSGLS